MDANTTVKVISGVLALALVGIIILRRKKKKSAEEDDF
jgi:LPXTG-motif cell wall-anchored protein